MMLTGAQSFSLRDVWDDGFKALGKGNRETKAVCGLR